MGIYYLWSLVAVCAAIMLLMHRKRTAPQRLEFKSQYADVGQALLQNTTNVVDEDKLRYLGRPDIIKNIFASSPNRYIDKSSAKILEIYFYLKSASLVYWDLDFLDRYFMRHCKPSAVIGYHDMIVNNIRNTKSLRTMKDLANMEGMRESPEMIHAFMDAMFNILPNLKTVKEKLDWKEVWDSAAIPFKPNSNHSDLLKDLEKAISVGAINSDYVLLRDELFACPLSNAIEEWHVYVHGAVELGRSEQEIDQTEKLFASAIIVRLRRRDAEVEVLNPQRVEEIYNRFANGVHAVDRFFL